MIPTKNTHSKSSQTHRNIIKTSFKERDFQSEFAADSFPKPAPTENNLKKLILRARNKEPIENDPSKLTSTQSLLRKIVSMDKIHHKYKIPKVEEKPKNVTILQRIPRKILLDDKFLHGISLGKESSKNWQIIKKRNPRLWKFHLGASSLNNSKETTLKVLTMAMKPLKNPSGKGDSRFYYSSPGLKRLTSLRNLDLNLKEVGSEGLKYLCEGGKRLTSLQNISLRFLNSKVSDEDMKELSRCLKRFPHLKGLKIGFGWCGEITSNGLNYLGDRLKRLGRLENLGVELSSCEKMTDYGIFVLKDWLIKLSSLRSFSLNFSHLQTMTNIGMVYLEEILKDNKRNLKNIDFRFDWCPNITNRGLIDLSQGIKSLTLLEEIYLYFSQCSEIGGLGVDAVSRALKGLKNLQKVNLNLCGTKVFGGEKVYFCSGEELKSLNLRVKLGDQELQYMGRNLLESLPFQKLNFGFVNCGKKLTDTGLADFGGRFCKFIALQNLQLKFLKCEGVTSQGFLRICEGLQTLKSLRNFSLSIGKPSSVFSGFGICGLSEVLKNCSKLRSFRLDCDFKQLSAKGLRALCEALKGLDSLERVFLRSNRLVGLKIIEISLSGQREIKESLNEMIWRLRDNIELEKNEKLLEVFEGIRKKNNMGRWREECDNMG